MALTMDSIYKLPRNKKIALLVAILCVVTGLYVYRFFMPGQEELGRLKEKLNKLVQQLDANKNIERDLQKFKKDIERLNIELANALTQLPNEKEIPEILRNISTLGRESNLEFTLFKPKPEQPQQFYADVPIELVALGNYHNTGIFFDRVSKLPRIINVINFNMTRAKDAKGKGDIGNLVTVSCLVNTYRFIEKAEKKSEGAKGEKIPSPLEKKEAFPKIEKK
jgi:type IV pilus assembly protein PilO